MDKNILKKIIKATSNNDIEKILQLLNDKIEWKPLGNDSQNYPRIAMGSNPSNGITERITNAMDAMLELEVENNREIKKAQNPRIALELAYNIKEGNLRNANQKKIGELASNINVKFLDSGILKRPTIEVYDRGIGQHPSDFPNTLLSINSNYKYTKFYLIGEFGQGGQSSFSYIDKYAIIISRKYQSALKSNQSDVLGCTIVRYHDPTTEEEVYPYGRYEYCIDSSTGNVFTFPSSALPIALTHGTIVRLISYDMPKGSSNALQPSGTAWGLLNESLFDPLLPLRLYEERKKYYNKDRTNRVLSGLAPRLSRGKPREKVRIAISDSYNDVDFGKHGTFKINYWALEPVEETGIRAKWRDIKKGFVSKNNAVFITLNGQKHEELSSLFLRNKCNLTYSSEYLIVHVDCDNLKPIAKKRLFTSTRERMKKGELEEMLLEEIANHIQLDRNLIKFENDRRDQIINARSKRDTSKIRQMVGKYISRYPELKQLISQKSTESTVDLKQTKEEPITDEIKDEELELPDLKEIPTYIKITNSKDPILVEKGGSALVRIETDAADEYLSGSNENRFRVVFEQNRIKYKSKSQLRNGKISYHIYCPRTVRISSKDKIIIELDLLGGEILKTEREVICREPYKRKKEKAKKKLLEPRIEAISHEDELWTLRGYDKKSVGEIWLDGPNPCIIVSVDNEHLLEVLNKMKNKEELRSSSEGRYVSAIAFYLFLRQVDKIDKKNGDEEDLSPSSSELQRVAKTVSSLVVPLEIL